MKKSAQNLNSQRFKSLSNKNHFKKNSSREIKCMSFDKQIELDKTIIDQLILDIEDVKEEVYLI